MVTSSAAGSVLLTCSHNPNLTFTAPIVQFGEHSIAYFDCLGELELVQRIVFQQSQEVLNKIGSDLAHTAIMYFGNGSTYGQCLGQALGLAISVVAWNEIKPKWSENVISSIPFSNITNPQNKMQNRLRLGWPQLAKFTKYDIKRLIIADDVAATGESIFAAEDLIKKASVKLCRSLKILGYVVAARAGNDLNPEFENRLLATPVFQIPVL
jgi:hypothetical protein